MLLERWELRYIACSLCLRNVIRNNCFDYGREKSQKAGRAPFEEEWSMGKKDNEDLLKEEGGARFSIWPRLEVW